MCKNLNVGSVFTNKTAIYEQYRPNYPYDLILSLKQKSFLKDNDIIAEFGCGTGKLTSLLLDNGNIVYGIEPNNEMLDFLRKKLNEKPNFHLCNATAEISNLPSHSFDVIISAQAFHLFNAKQAKQEFYRLIKKNGYILLLWYFINKNSSISKKIRNLFYQHGAKENLHKRQKINLYALQKLFYPNIVKYQIITQFKKSFSNEEFINSMLSSSYAPVKGNANYFDYINQAQSIYNKYSIYENYIEYDFQIHLYTIQAGK